MRGWVALMGGGVAILISLAIAQAQGVRPDQVGPLWQGAWAFGYLMVIVGAAANARTGAVGLTRLVSRLRFSHRRLTTTQRQAFESRLAELGYTLEAKGYGGESIGFVISSRHNRFSYGFRERETEEALATRIIDELEQQLARDVVGLFAFDGPSVLTDLVIGAPSKATLQPTLRFHNGSPNRALAWCIESVRASVGGVLSSVASMAEHMVIGPGQSEAYRMPVIPTSVDLGVPVSIDIECTIRYGPAPSNLRNRVERASSYRVVVIADHVANIDQESVQYSRVATT